MKNLENLKNLGNLKNLENLKNLRKKIEIFLKKNIYIVHIKRIRWSHSFRERGQNNVSQLDKLIRNLLTERIRIFRQKFWEVMKQNQ